MNDILSDKDLRFHKAKLLRGNCTTLRKYKPTNYPEVTSVVNHLYDEMVAVYGFILTRTSSIKRLKHHIEFFVLNLYKAYCNNPDRVIAYSRDHSDYSGKKSRYKNKFGLSFRYSLENSKDGKPVLNFLEKQGYLKNFIGYIDKKNLENSYQSRMRATQKLIHLIVNKYKVSDGMIEYDYSDQESVVVKGVKPKPRWVNYIENGEKKRKKIRRKRKICKTLDNPAVREMRKNLEIINEVMEKGDITLDISDKGLRELNERMLDDLDPYKQVIDFTRKRLYRVFLDRRLDRGGRFYGPWYQNIPKEYRQYIMIDGAPTLELDYSALHPNLLYYYADADPPQGDLYEIDGYSKDTRNFMKAIFLRMINSESRNAAKGAIRYASYGYSKKKKEKKKVGKKKKRLKVPSELGNLENKYLDPLIDKFLEKHSAIKKYIFKVKDLGNILQNVDSRIAEKVLLYFALGGVPVLPMHDSFRIDARLYDKLEEIMHRVIKESFGRYIRISNDDYVPLLQRLIEMVDKEIEEGDYDFEEFRAFVMDIDAITKKMQLDLKNLEELKKKKADNIVN